MESDWAIVLLTSVLVLATIWYAYTTRAALTEARRANDLAEARYREERRAVLVIDMEAREFLGAFAHIVVHNYGGGYAEDVRLESYLLDDLSVSLGVDIPWIAPHGKEERMVPKDRFMVFSDMSDAVVRVAYTDVLGRHEGVQLSPRPSVAASA